MGDFQLQVVTSARVVRAEFSRFQHRFSIQDQGHRSDAADRANEDAALIRVSVDYFDTRGAVRQAYRDLRDCDVHPYSIGGGGEQYRFTGRFFGFHDDYYYPKVIAVSCDVIVIHLCRNVRRREVGAQVIVAYGASRFHLGF